MQTPIRVAAAIIQDGDRILAAQRATGNLAGGWEFPGGKIEPGETPEDACIREIREELGIEIDHLAPFCALDYAYPGSTVHFEIFTCRIAEGIPECRDHTAFVWLAPSDYLDVAWLPADLQVVHALRASRDGNA